MRHYSLVLLLGRTVAALPFFTQKLNAFGHRKETPPLWSPEFYEKIAISAVLVLLGGVFAGCAHSPPHWQALLTTASLTLGLMGLDELHLRVLAASSDNPTEKRNAKKGTCFVGAEKGTYAAQS